MAFRDLDVHLDRAEFGPTWLAWSPVAEHLVHIIKSADNARGICALHAFVVMPNHVHLLITPMEPLCEVTKWIKGASAREANRLLTRTGERFWQDESFDPGLGTQPSLRRSERISGTILLKQV